MRHGARCETRTRCSLTRMSASREALPWLGATRNWTLALPCPDRGDSSEIQSAPGAVSHAHSGCVVTLNALIPPTASTTEGGVNTSSHLAGLGSVERTEFVSQAPTTA